MLENVLAILDDAADPLTLGSVMNLIIQWLVECDRGEAVEDEYNHMHVVGIALCVSLDKQALSIPAYTNADQQHAHLFLDGGSIARYDVRTLQEFVCNMQTEFNSLYDITDEGYVCHIDVSYMLVAVMQRLGYWIRHDFMPEANNLSLHDIADPDAEGWHVLRPIVIRHMLDVVHTMLGVHRMLVTATPLPPCTFDFEIHPVHIEASMDSWWELSTVADCPVGGITQYKHQFQYLFHSVSQVIYYHYPSYNRRNQKPYEELMKPAHDYPALHLLPPLLQVAPEIPVLYEHTGAGYCHSTRAPFSWCVVGHFLLMIDSDMNVFCARDPRVLLQHATVQKGACIHT